MAGSTCARSMGEGNGIMNARGLAGGILWQEGFAGLAGFGTVCARLSCGVW